MDERVNIPMNVINYWSWDPAIDYRQTEIKEEQNGSSKTTEGIGS
jgi:hypothetical protein